MESKPHYEVVAAVIEHDNKILCVKRGQTRFPYTSHKYEFPGGKIEEGETEVRALRREIHEELKIWINVGVKLRIVEHEYPDFSVTIHFYHCNVFDEHITLVEHENAIWATPSEMADLDWVAADRKVVFG